MSLARRIVPGLALAAVAVVSTACFEDEVPTAQVGGTEYYSTLFLQSGIRVPSASVITRPSNTTASRVVIDSVVLTASNLKPLEGAARYQLWLVNQVDSSAVAFSPSIILRRTDTTFASGAVTTVTRDSVLGPRAFFQGAPFNTQIIIRVLRSAGLDSTRGTAVLTMQADTASPAFDANTPKFLWYDFRDQRGTTVLTDDLVPASGNAVFGTWIRPGSVRRFNPVGTGRSAFWDRDADGRLVYSALLLGLPQPPLGYYYAPWLTDPATGRLARFPDISHATTGESLRDADLLPLQGTLAQLPNARFGAHEDSLEVLQTGAAGVRFLEFGNVQLVLEPKLGVDDYPNAAVVLQAAVPSIVAARRDQTGVIKVTVTAGGTPVANASVALFGSASGAFIRTTATSLQGVAILAGLPKEPVDVRLVPPSGRTVTSTNPVLNVMPAADTARVEFTVSAP